MYLSTFSNFQIPSSLSPLDLASKIASIMRTGVILESVSTVEQCMTRWPALDEAGARGSDATPPSPPTLWPAPRSYSLPPQCKSLPLIKLLRIFDFIFIFLIFLLGLNYMGITSYLSLFTRIIVLIPPPCFKILSLFRDNIELIFLCTQSYIGTLIITFALRVIMEF